MSGMSRRCANSILTASNWTAAVKSATWTGFKRSSLRPGNRCKYFVWSVYIVVDLVKEDSVSLERYLSWFVHHFWLQAGRCGICGEDALGPARRVLWRPGILLRVLTHLSPLNFSMVENCHWGGTVPNATWCPVSEGFAYLQRLFSSRPSGPPRVHPVVFRFAPPRNPLPTSLHVSGCLAYPSTMSLSPRPLPAPPPLFLPQWNFFRSSGDISASYSSVVGNLQTVQQWAMSGLFRINQLKQWRWEGRLERV